MTNCFLAIGSNLNRPQYQLRLAIQAIAKLPRSYLLKVAPFYKNPAFGRKVQPIFYNTVVKISTSLSPESLLYYCNKIEAKQGRLRLLKNGARTVDIDILLYGSRKIKTSKLKIPHPEMEKRDFVLVPFRQIV